ncbi:hypothetical protein N7468_005777 [Penicillium chermesinum]|uniref:Uncharacterized protein n=1 Tax=Penicillium chermesinum TaxID=63820 RepID=A0A9W9TNA6_9EURO|nr:uncharacterized protein N7468_005777 [Penicillium chermesinum]KAJ5232821.1 hypothetical protein N7468_005777 [Penicillium chermesinum]
MSNNPKNPRGTPDQATQSNRDDSGAPAAPSSNAAPATNNDTPPPSLASRVQRSAAGLARSAFQGASAGAAQTIAGATDSKAGAPSASRPAAGSASRDILSPGARKGSGIEIPGMTEDEFQRAGSIPDVGATQSYEEPGARSHGAEGLQEVQAGSWKGKQRAYDPVQVYSSAWERARTETEGSGMQVPVTDGEAVASLLADPSFDPSFEADAEADGLDLDLAAAPPPLTREEIDMLESFRRELQKEDGSRMQGSEPGQQLSAHSLVPDIDTFLQQNDPVGYAQTSSAGATTLRDNVLANLPGAEDWVGVHERYHDEVWGVPSAGFGSGEGGVR